jgi:cholesterol transport system auxiliary component
MIKAFAMLLLTLGGCALFSKSEPLSVRYYTPSPPPSGPTGAGSGIALRLGRVDAGTFLRERIAFQASAHELGFYETKRWTERPEAYLRRELTRALFEEAGASHVLSGPAPTLDVELLDFTELRGQAHAARVRLRAVVSDGRTVLFERTFTAEQQVADDDDFEPVVAAMSKALSSAVSQLAQSVLSAVRASTPEVSAPSAPTD